MNINVLSVNELDQFKEELLEELKSLLNSNPSNNEVYLRSAQVREMLNISDSTLQNFRITSVR